MLRDRDLASDLVDSVERRSGRDPSCVMRGALSNTTLIGANC